MTLIPVRLPLLNTPNPDQQALEAEAQALADANELLNDGYTLIFREQVKVGQDAVANLYFHKASAPIGTPEQDAIKKAFRIFRTDPEDDGLGGHPDTRKLNRIIKALIKSGVLPDDEPPPTDDTQVDVTPRKLQEVKW